jgi:hypothetical protein
MKTDKVVMIIAVIAIIAVAYGVFKHLGQINAAIAATSPDAK